MKRQTQISTSVVLFLVGIFILSIPIWMRICETMPYLRAWVGLVTLCVVIWSAGQLYLRFAKSRISK
jgi:hypothetical protein